MANGNGTNGNGGNGHGVYGPINNAITGLLLTIVVLMIPFNYSLNQSVARLQSEHDSFVADQAMEHEEIVFLRRQCAEAKEKLAALEAITLAARPPH